MQLEGCHSSILGPQPRGRTTESLMPDGYVHRQVGDFLLREVYVRRVRTEWLPMKCGIVPQAGHIDAGCIGCANYPEKNNES